LCYKYLNCCYPTGICCICEGDKGDSGVAEWSLITLQRGLMGKTGFKLKLVLLGDGGEKFKEVNEYVVFPPSPLFISFELPLVLLSEPLSLLLLLFVVVEEECSPPFPSSLSGSGS